MSETLPQLPVAIAAPTGAVGQRFVQLLHDHPYFSISALAASDRNVGKTYGEAVDWRLDHELPPEVADIELSSLQELSQPTAPLAVFSALPSEVAKLAESELAAAGKAVFSNAAAHRMDQDVPLLIAEVNPEHLLLIDEQPTGGFIVANANCSSIIMTLPFAPLHKEFGIEETHVATWQALSGAGNEGVSALAITDNVIPFIAGEQDKLRQEPLKMLGTAHTPADFPIFPTVTRVPVRDGHLIIAHLSLAHTATVEQLEEALHEFQGLEEVSSLPSAPHRPLHMLRLADRPQPRLDRDCEGGMGITVGPISEEPKADSLGRQVFQVSILGHNTIRGAAGQSVLNAELAYRRGLLTRWAFRKRFFDIMKP